MDYRKYLSELVSKSLYPTLKNLTETLASRIEKAIQSKENPTHFTVTNPTDITPVVEAQNATTEAVRSIRIPEPIPADFSSLEAKIEALKEAFEKKEMTVNVGKTEVNVDNKAVVKAIEKLKLEIPKLKEQEVIDYTLIFDEMMGIMERPHYSVDMLRIQETLGKLATTEDMVTISAYLQALIDKPLPEQPNFKFDKDGNLLVSPNKVGGGGGGGLTKIETEALENISTNSNTQATEAKQDEIIAGQYPTGTGSNGTVTLTSASTAYAINSAPASSYSLVVYNGSANDAYWGYGTLTTGGILLPAGGTLTLNIGANQTIYLYSATAGTVINYSQKLI